MTIRSTNYCVAMYGLCITAGLFVSDNAYLQTKGTVKCTVLVTYHVMLLQMMHSHQQSWNLALGKLQHLLCCHHH